LGRATVERFVEEGAAVVIADVAAARGEALAKQLGTPAAFKHTDVANAAMSRPSTRRGVWRPRPVQQRRHRGTDRRLPDDELKDFRA
jgi:NAD(P)-dependent dehydrogenase (short-subunit alcohol dehydrogenase family)